MGEGGVLDAVVVDGEVADGEVLDVRDVGMWGI